MNNDDLETLPDPEPNRCPECGGLRSIYADDCVCRIATLAREAGRYQHALATALRFLERRIAPPRGCVGGTIMADYACDACPHRCRAGIYVTGEVNHLECATRNGTPDWKKTDIQTDARPSFVRAPAPDNGPVTFVPAGETVLLGCQGCGPGAPCLLEITGPVTERLGCVLGIECPPYRVCVWYRVK